MKYTTNNTENTKSNNINITNEDYNNFAPNVKNGDKALLYRLLNHFKNAVILDVETTGLATGNDDLEKNKELTNISVIDAITGKNIYTTFVKPKHPISDQLAIVNIINNDIVKDAPDFSEIYDEIIKATKGKKIIGWNIQFDVNTIIEEAKKLNRNYLEDADIEGIEDGMELAMRASGLFKYTYSTAMFWKQDEACKLFDSYIYNANDIEKFAHKENYEDHIKDLENYIDTAFDEKYRKELHNQLGTKEMHLAYCDNKEYRLTMMKATEMFRRGITADKDKFMSCLMTSLKRNRYKSMLRKEQNLSEIIERIRKGENVDDLRKEYSNKVGGNRAFDSALLSNKNVFKGEEHDPFDVSPYVKEVINKKFKELGNIFDVSDRTGYDILTVRNNLVRDLTYSDMKEFEKANENLDKNSLDADTDKREDVINNSTNSNLKEKNNHNAQTNQKSPKNTLKNSISFDNYNNGNKLNKEKEAKKRRITKIEEQLGRNNKPLSSEIVENLSSKEQQTLNDYLSAKCRENELKKEYKAYEDVLSSKMSELGFDEKVIFQDKDMKITFNPKETLKSTFDRTAFEKECPEISHKYLMTEITDENLEKLQKKYPSIYNLYHEDLDNGKEFFDYESLKINYKDIYNEFATPAMNTPRKTFRFTPFGEELSFPEVEKMEVNEDFIEKMAKIADAQSTYKGIAEELQIAVQQIITAHDCMRIDGEKGRVSYSVSTPKQKFNTTLLRSEEPDLYAYYCSVDLKENTLDTSAYPKQVARKSREMSELYDELKSYNIDFNAKKTANSIALER